jgi:hypothetical protein
VFLDETLTTPNMTRRHGRAQVGERCIGAVPHGHWKTTTFVAGLRHDRLTAPMLADGPMDGALFLAYGRTFWCPTLKPGDVVIADQNTVAKEARLRSQERNTRQIGVDWHFTTDGARIKLKHLYPKF